MTETPGQPDDQPDERLRALLRSADPAAALSQADPTRVARLLEDTMTGSTEPRLPETDESRADGTHGRSRLTWLVAAAAVVLIAAVATFGLTRADDSAPTAGDAPAAPVPSDAASSDTPGSPEAPDSATPGAESITRLDVPESPSGRCLPPEANPQILAGQDIAFDGIVEQVSRGLVTLRPTTFYAGDATDLVVVRAPSPEMLQLLVGVEFREGERYLVSATDAQVTLCGFSAPWTPALEDLYTDAFAD